MLTHVKSHEGAPFPCSQCEIQLSSKQLLHRHLQVVHKEKKMYLCSFCGRRFRDTYGLNRHLREGHRIKPNPPTIKTTDKSKKETCILCDMVVTRLEKHLNDKHGVDRALKLKTKKEYISM